ncbi:MAG TPA: hypothetical protein VLB07_00040 [Woeseiaceae bacterium]|nr:hypothetical protein [Woeseiaceae bacterium]
MSEVRELRQYKKKPGTDVVAVRLELDTEGFSYEKWGSTQRCKPGDWIVCNNGDTYTVDAETFAKTYEETGPGTFIKATPVWAGRASEEGSIRTKEGSSRYKKGDYIVYNDADRRDGYVVSAKLFEAMYQLVK